MNTSGHRRAFGHGPRRLAVAFLTLCMLRTVPPPLLAAEIIPARPLTIESDYRHVHQSAAFDLFAANAQAAADWCHAFLAVNPGDPEAWFILTGALAHLGQAEEAQEALENALRAGVPWERFLAGPRQAFSALTTSAWFQELAALRPPALVLHGPLLSDLTERSVKIWIRTGTAATAVAIATELGRGTETSSAPVQTGLERDFTAVLQIDGLKPQTEYRYRLRVDEQPVPSPTNWVFKTRPLPGAPHRFSVAFGGGAAYKPELERMWWVMAARRPDAFLALGDNIYIDTPNNPNYQRYLYYRRQSSPGFRVLVAQTPVYAIYDDHDFGTNDCSGGPGVDEPAWKRLAFRIFTENWANPYYAGGTRQPGCWFDFSIGNVAFFLLDGRYYRTEPSVTPAETRSMLGPVQKRWLLDKLKTSSATFKVLASDVPWAPGAKPDSLDAWDGFAREREEIFSFVATHRIEGVLLLSADRHRHDVWRIDRPNAYPLFEFESSRITNIHSHPTMKRALFSYNGRGFGFLQFDTAQPDPVVTAHIIGERNQVVHAFQVRRSQLAFPAN